MKKIIINGAVTVLLAFIMAVIMVYLYNTREDEDSRPSYIFNPEPGVEAAPLVSHPFFGDEGILMQFIDGIEFESFASIHYLLINNADLYVSIGHPRLEYFDEAGDVWRRVPMHTPFFFEMPLNFWRPQTTNLITRFELDRNYYMIPGQKYRIRRTVGLTKRTADSSRMESMPHDFVLEFYWTDNPFQRVVPAGD